MDLPHLDAPIAPMHVTSVDTVGGRYPHRPACSCGQAFRGYVTQPAAQDVADAHMQEMRAS